MWLQQQNKELFIPLWLIASAILWYIGFAMWLAGLVGFIIGWILARLLEKLGYAVISYQITHRQAIMDLPIVFTLPLWKKLLTVLLPVRRETIRAEIWYLYEEMGTQNAWCEEAIWKENNSSQILIDETGEKTIPVLKFPNPNSIPTTIGGKPLPNKLTLDIRIKRVSDAKLRAYFKIPLEID